MKLRVAIPILLGSAAIMLSSLGLAIAQERPQAPQVRIPRPGQRPIVPGQLNQNQAQGGDDEAPAAAGKLRPFRTGLEDRPSGRVPPGSRVEFTLEDADLPDLVRMISRITGKRFILPGKARSVKATVVSTEPVTAAEAYRAFLSILDLNGMTVVPSGRYLKIVEAQNPEKQPGTIYTEGQATPTDDRYVTRMVRAHNVSAEDLATLLGRFQTQNGSIVAYAPTNTLIITDTGANIRRLLNIMQEIDVPRTGEQIWIEPIHYANAADMAARLQEIFPSAGQQSGSAGAAAKARPTPSPRRGRQGAQAGQQAGASTIGTARGESRITNIIPDERTNSLIILATERAYLRILEVIRALDIPVEGEGSIHVHQLQYADAEEMASTLSSLVGGTGSRAAKKGAGAQAQQAAAAAAAGGTGSALQGEINVQAHKATNSLLITSSLHDYVALRRVIERLDSSPRQVFIEAVIMELSVQRSSSLGLSYHGGIPEPTIDGSQSLTVFGFDAGNSIAPLSADLLTGLAVGVRGPEIDIANELIGFSVPSFGVMLNAVANAGDVNVLSTPHIMAMDNVQAEITVGANVPLQTSGIAGGIGSLAGLAGQAGQASNLAGIAGLAGLGSLGLGGFGGIQRQNVGTTIRITPHVNDSNEIRMEIEEEISETQPAQGTLGVVPISQRIAKTQVVVRDQQTVVIGGLMRDRISTSEDKIPILGDIPLLGVLFRRQTTQAEKTNLILFLTPYIIRSEADLRAIFARKLRERQEFIDRHFVFSDRGYTPAIDYSRTRGLVSEILNTMQAIEEEQRLMLELQSRPPPEHVPRPPIGASPIDGHDESGSLVIGPDGDEDGGSMELEIEPPQDGAEVAAEDVE